MGDQATDERSASSRGLRVLLWPEFWLNGRGFYALLAIFFLFAAIVQTWPLVLHASDSIINWPRRPEDSWVNLWNLWWVKESTLALESPLETDSLFYPQGAELYFHTLNTVNGYMSVPLQLLTGNVVLSWNVLMLGLFVLSGLTTFALARRVTGSRAAGIVAAYTFAFSPFVMMRLHGHWNIATVWMLPLLAWCAVVFQETRRIRYAAAAGVVAALITYNSQEYGADTAVFLSLFFLYWTAISLKERRFRPLRGLWVGAGITAVTWFIVAAPLLVGMLDSSLNSEVSEPPGRSNLFTDLEALITPSPLWGPGETPSPVPAGVQHFPTGDVENTVYLGITPLLLGVVAVATIRSWRHPAVFWSAVFAVFTVLALGPHLFIGDTKDFSLLGVDFTVPLPYQLYEQVPFLEQRRGISRLIVYGHLGLAVLAAIGVQRLLNWIPAGYQQYAPYAALVALMLVGLEYWTPPNTVTAQPGAAAIAAIADEPGDFSVLSVPLGRSSWWVGGSQPGAYLSTYYARIHEKSTLGGYLARAPDEDTAWTMNQPALKYLSCPTCAAFPTRDDLDPDIARETMLTHRVKYVILHRVIPSGTPAGGPELAALDGYMRTVLGMEPVHEDPAYTIFRNPRVGP